jgi:ubiquinol-cytochrome c reductase iron-sulfur subunit
MSASADVLAMAKVEVDLAAIPEGKNVSKPIVVFRKRRGMGG